MSESSDQNKLSHLDSPSEAGSDTATSTQTTGSKQAAEGLPEEFELTPELVEEEAIRGDFVLRWSAVLLAVMFGSTVITHTETLLEVRAGEYLLSHGILPDGKDPFAYTTEGRVWRNHAWLFDIVLAGVYGIGGAIGLTVFKALLAGLVFWCVVTISRPRTSTWWNAIVATIGAVACAPFFTARPELVTLVGVALLLRTIHVWRYETKPSLNWKLPVLFLFWANMDPRMYLGLLILLVAACGESLRRKVHPDSPQFPRGVLWQTVGICFLAALINPFGWHSLLSAWNIHAVSDPATRELLGSYVHLEGLYYFNLMHGGWWTSPRIPFIAALTIGGLALISFYLNYTRLNIAHILMWLLVSGLAFATGREIGPAVVVCCMIASLNCQDWYRESFRLEYSVRKLELLFSRGGRALTVLAFVATAYLGIRGYAFEGYETRIGFGFENILKNSLSGLEEDLAHSYDERPFNFTARQGDMLIWTGKKVFFDSRVGLFTGSGEDDLIAEHQRARTAMRLTEGELRGTDKSDAEIWQTIFDKYNLTLALPHLTGTNPDYQTYNDLMLSRQSTDGPSDWSLTHLGPSAASFYRQANKPPEYQEYLKKHRFNFLDEAFRKKRDEEDTLSFERGDFPQPETAYERYLTSRREVVPKQLALARHYAQYLEQADLDRIRMDIPTLAAISCLSIRNANEALSENPESSQAFLLLGEIYRYLLKIEPAHWQASQTPYDPSQRYMQSMLAYQQSRIGNPDNPGALFRLRDLYLSQNRLQMAREIAIRLQTLLARDKQVAELFGSQAQTENTEILEELGRQIDPILENVRKLENDEKPDPFQLATELANQMFHLEAIRILKAHPELREPGQPGQQSLRRFQTEFLWGLCHLEMGDAEEAYQTFQKLEVEFEQLQKISDFQPQIVTGYLYSSLAAVGHADYRKAISARKSIAQISENRSLFGLLVSAPIVGDADRYNLRRMQSYFSWVGGEREILIQNLWWIAVMELERGRNDAGIEMFKRILEISPDTSLRPLVARYLYALGELNVDPIGPGDRIPVTPDLFTPDETAPETPEIKESND
ncbi:MAG TPA: tetratricopeptide repeat protein [Planctomycetaceae bacterium]|nr:tetratricopeptide repeat protein [Planctomycetaceae bacterium]